MINLFRIILCLSAFILPAANSVNFADEINPASPFEFTDSSDPVKVELIAEEDSIQSGHPFWVAIRMSIDEHWHAYWKNPGDAGMAPVIVWNLPEGFQAGTLHWPTPKRFNLSSNIGFGYEGEVMFLVQITPSDSLSQTTPVNISADMRWVVCSDTTCLPGDGHISLTLPVSKDSPHLDRQSTAAFTGARSQIPQKNGNIAAERKQDTIEISFNDTHEEHRAFHDVHFFPENNAVDYKTAPVLKQSEASSKQHIITLKPSDSEDAQAASLRGVLVLHSRNAIESYDVDVPIQFLEGSDNVISMETPIYAVGNRALHPKELTIQQDNNFEFEGGFALALLFAFLGGMILNLMPCVLPVISFKVLSFIKLAGESRKLIFQHGIAFSSGILLSFWILAGILLALQAYGRLVGWGFQLQEPLFVAALASALLIFALSLFGLFEMGASLISAAGQVQASSNKNSGLFGSFLSGVLATAVATPCTGPFLGSAVGFAFTLPAPLTLLIFTSLGLGMSLPYLALAAYPPLLRFMPKAGPWMVAFKELMGFFMLATVLWLVWIFGALTSALAISVLLAGFLFIALACWIYGRWGSAINKRSTRTCGFLTAAALVACGGYAIILASSSWVEAMSGQQTASTLVAEAGTSGTWEEFSPERVAELRKQGIPVFIDFTAKWCLICQANHLILSTDEVSEKFAELGVVLMKADWTKNDERIAAELRKFGRNSVPLYVLYHDDPEAKPQILPQVLTPETVIDALRKLEQ